MHNHSKKEDMKREDYKEQEYKEQDIEASYVNVTQISLLDKQQPFSEFSPQKKNEDPSP